MLVKNIRDDIWVIPMPKIALGHLVLCILPVRPFYFYVKKSLSLTVKYNRMLNKIFEQNRKEGKLKWRQILDMELH
jgi:hypothetical protein